MTTIGWIGDISWSKEPFVVVGEYGIQSATLFKTRKDALEAGWPKPTRVKVTIRKVK